MNTKIELKRNYKCPELTSITKWILVNGLVTGHITYNKNREFKYHGEINLENQKIKFKAHNLKEIELIVNALL